MNIQGMVKLGSSSSSVLPPLMDSSSSPYNNETSHVTCFSEPMEEDQKTQEEEVEDMIDPYNSSLLASSSSSNPNSEISPVSNSFFMPTWPNLQYPDSFLMQDQPILKMLLENHGPNMKTTVSKAEFSQDSAVSNHEVIQRSFQNHHHPQHHPSSSCGPVDLDCLWNY